MRALPTVIRILDVAERSVLDRVAHDVFDHAVDRKRALEFLEDPRHHLAVAVNGDRVVGFASGVTYVHPDKAPEFWVNEVGVSAPYRRQGLGQRLLEALFSVGRAAGCSEAWVLTERDNDAACALYRSLGGSEPPQETVMFSFQLPRPA